MRSNTGPQDNLEVGVRSEAGGRTENEDACAVIELGGGEVLVVADGAGGHASGEVASARCVSAVVDFFGKPESLTGDPALAVRNALHAAHRAVRDHMKRDRTLRTMRSTIVLVLGTRTEAFVGHVGDSRAYLVRNGKAKRLTRDDTIVQTLVDIGQIEEEAAKTHSKANVLTQSVGDPKELEYHVNGPIQIHKGDRILACSDGVWEILTDQALADAVSIGEPDVAARVLVSRAVEAGASDNVTAGVMAWPHDAIGPVTSKFNAVGIVSQKKKKRSRSFEITVAILLGLTLCGAAFVRWRRHTQHEPVRTETHNPR